MANERPVRLFLDASALFAGIWSDVGGGRAILKLGEARTIHLLSSSQVLKEVEAAFREKAPELLAKLTLLVDAANFEIVGKVTQTLRKKTMGFLDYARDAEILAAAMSADVEYFVTLDKSHFLSNKKLGAMPFEIGTPGDFLAWYRSRIAAIIIK